MGIEPTPTAWEAIVLPLNYARLNLVEIRGVEPLTSSMPWMRSPN